MKRTGLAVTMTVAVLAAGAGVLVAARGRAAGTTAYRTVAVERGDVISTVSATGILKAVSTVQVGTQVSGLISELHADFNSKVRQGDLIARLDSTVLALAVRQAEAAVRQTRADSAQKQFTLDQARVLASSGLEARADLVAAQTANETAQASLTSAEIALERAVQNLRYVDIYAPIDGTVIEREVDVGQTVQASFSAPQLFLIAADLKQMQILVSVDEADIGEVKVAQKVQFTVQAYPNRIFTGTVRQVRLQSASSNNVVSYTVVVGVQNPDLALLPGMTATVTFEVARARDVLKVANAALRYQAPAAWLAAWRAAHPAASVAADTGTAQLWSLDAQGRPSLLLVRTGLTDGQSTELLDGAAAGLKEGMRFVAGVAASGKAATGAASPFQATQQRGGTGGPPPGPPGGV